MHDCPVKERSPAWAVTPLMCSKRSDRSHCCVAHFRCPDVALQRTSHSTLPLHDRLMATRYCDSYLHHCCYRRRIPLALHQTWRPSLPSDTRCKTRVPSERKRSRSGLTQEDGVPAWSTRMSSVTSFSTNNVLDVGVVLCLLLTVSRTSSGRKWISNGFFFEWSWACCIRTRIAALCRIAWRTRCCDAARVIVERMTVLQQVEMD